MFLWGVGVGGRDGSGGGGGNKTNSLYSSQSRPTAVLIKRKLFCSPNFTAALSFSNVKRFQQTGKSTPPVLY